MSDASPGPGWWLASDGRWYPPPAPGGATHHGDAGGGARRVAENWQKGADGEAAVARELTSLPVGYRVFHDLKEPGAGKANIDHLVIGPSGVWLIDTKAWSGELRAGNGTLWRGRTPIRREVEAVERQANSAAERLGADVNPMLCFVGTTLPRPAQMVGRTRAVTIEALVDHIAGAPQVLLPPAVDALDHWARTMQVSSPRQPDRRPPRSGAAPTPARSKHPEARPGADRPGKLLPLVLRMVVSGIAVVGAMALVWTATDELRHGRTGPAGPTTTTVASGDVATSVECPTPGQGWRFQARRSMLPSEPRARVTASVNGLPAFLAAVGRPAFDAA